jgi:glycerol-3-phosphate dehydrogenase
LPLLGADGLAAAAAEAERLAEDYGLPWEAVEHLLDRYGTLTEEVLELTRDDPALAQPVAGGHPYLGAEVAYAVTHEGALHVEDVLVRRVRLFIETGTRGADAVGPVTRIMGDLLGWDNRQRAAETERYLHLLQADKRALSELTAVSGAARETAG